MYFPAFLFSIALSKGFSFFMQGIILFIYLFIYLLTPKHIENSDQAIAIAHLIQYWEKVSKH